MSGWRRSVPVPEQGASSRMASNCSVGVHLLASAVTSSAEKPARVRFSPSRVIRRSEMSTAVTCAPAAQSCRVLPPGAAHRSATRLPVMSPSRRAGRVAAASCTHQVPSAKPGSSVMAPPAGRRSVPGRQDFGLEPAGPEIGIGARREIERRLDQMGGGDGARRVLAIALGPAFPQPLRRIEARRIAVAEQCRAVAGDCCAARRWPGPSDASDW